MDACLITWLKTFDVCPSSVSLVDLTDGVIIARVLHQISSSFFSDAWLNKIKTDHSLDKRIKVSNLRKVVGRVGEYFIQVLKHEITESCTPKIVAIAEDQDVKEMCLLLKLVLFCAVKCENSQDYINQITSLDESVQVAIMQSIQELLKVESDTETLVGKEKSSLCLQLQKANEEIENLVKQKETLTRNYNELQHNMDLVQEEKSKLVSDITELKERLQVAENLEDLSTLSGHRHQQVLNQLQKLKEELLQMETSKHETQAYCEKLEKELGELKLKSEQLEFENREVIQLRDEVDLLRSADVKLRKSESQIEMYKKKQDEFDDLKVQLKLMEECNSQYLESQQQMEQEIKKLTICKAQMDEMRLQIKEMKSELDKEHSRADRLEIENRQLREKLTTALHEKELLEEQSLFRESNEEMMILPSHQVSSGENFCTLKPNTPQVQCLGLPLEIREKVFNLEQENKRMKMQLASKDTDLVSRVQLEEAAAKNTEMEAELRNLNYRALELEAETSCVGELQSKVSAQESANIILRRRLVEQLQRSRKLEVELQKTKEQLSESQETVVSLKSRNLVAETDILESSAEKWKTILEEKVKFVHDLEDQLQEEKNRNEKEEKLLITAWYNLGHQIQMKSALSRLSSGVTDKNT